MFDLDNELRQKIVEIHTAIYGTLAADVQVVNIPQVIVSDVAETIDIQHQEIHEGKHFTNVIYDSSVDIAAPKYVMYKAPNSAIRCHFFFKANVLGSGGLVEFYEAPTTTADGTIRASSNNDLNSVNAATLVSYEDPTVTADGTRKDADAVGTTGGPTKFGGQSVNRYEWILKQNTKYIIKVTPTANGTPVIVTAQWYEIF